MTDFKEVSMGVSYPFGLISDVHLHPWSAYSHTTKEGLNNRLQHILDGIEQAATAVLKAGGQDLFITGDLFHTRGEVKPSVLNPTIDLFKDLICRGIKVHAFDGNHDMEMKKGSKYGSAMYALGLIDGFNIYYEPTIIDKKYLLIPFVEEVEEVLDLATKGSILYPNLTIFCHVGMSGVLPGNMGHVLNVDDLLELDIKYVFSGHFHNHVSFNSRVYSVGALNHQTWGDVGSLAGYLIATEDEVTRYETNAPKFVNLEVGTDVCGNYVRIKDVELSDDEAEELVAKLRGEDCAALAVLDQSTRPTIKDKDALKEVVVDVGLETALETFCKHTYGDNWKEVFEACLRLKS